MNVNIDTKMVTLLGTPLRQSFAARMQNRGYEAAGLNMIYFYTEVDNEHLGDVVNGLRYMNFAGFAVTKPNKVRVLEYLDELDPLCEKMGSCNTVVRTDEGRLIGYNTDGMGFYRSFAKEADIDPGKHTFFCIGSGGAGRAICSALAYHGAEKIYVADVAEEAGRAFVRELRKRFGANAEFVPSEKLAAASGCDVVLNASGIGMGESVGRTPLPREYIREGQIYFDACYNPMQTQFLLNAGEKGCRVINGLGMSLYQGAAQIELWTGKKAPVEAMRQELMNIMAERSADRISGSLGRDI